MLQQVEMKIAELKKLQAKEYYEKKEDDLHTWGLTQKTTDGKIIPLVITDEEYEALIEASNGVNSAGSRNNSSKLFSALSLVMIALGISGGIAAMALSENMSLVYFSISLIAGFVMAAVFKGIAEVLKLLQQIIDKKEVVAKPQGEYKKEEPRPAAPQYQVTYTTAQPPVFGLNPNQVQQPVQYYYVPQQQVPTQQAAATVQTEKRAEAPAGIPFDPRG